MKRSLFVGILLLCANFALAQAPTYNLTLKNDTLVGTSAYEFDIYLERTGGTPFELATLQAVMTFDTSIITDSLSFTMNSGTSELTIAQHPTNGKLSISGNELRIAANAPPGAGSGTFISVSPGMRVGRFRLTSNVPFPNHAASIAWKDTGSNPVTKINAYVGGSNDAVTDPASEIDLLVNPLLSPVIITTASTLPEATAGTAYSQSLSATGGTAPYTWSVASGAFPSGISLSANGLISGTATVAGTYAVVIQATDSVSSSATKSFSLTVQTGPATHLAFVQQPSGATAGSTIAPPITVQVRDAFENNVAEPGDSISLSLSSGTGTLSGTLVRTTSAAGLATFNDLNINLTGSKIFTASSPGLTSAVSDTFTVTAGNAKTLVYVQQPTNAVSNTAMAPPVTLQVRDSLGNNVLTAGISVTISLSSGNGVLSGTTTSLTNASGIATFSDLSINLAGNKTLSATGTGLTPVVSGIFAISSGLVTRLEIIQQPTNTASGSPITPSVTVRLRDNAGNNVALSGVEIAAELLGSGTLSGTVLKTTNAGGLATFNDLSIDIAGSKRLRVTNSGLSPDTSGTFTISAGSPARVVFVQQPSNGIAGVAVAPPITVQLKDAAGNDAPVAGDTVSISLASGSGNVTGTLNRLTNASGLATFNDLVLTQGGLKTVTASGTGLLSATSNSFTMGTYTITATAAPNGTISPSGGVSVVSGSSQAFSITPNTGYHIDSVVADGFNLGPVTGYTFTNVTANHAIAAYFTINSYSITVTAGANGTITPTGTVVVTWGSNLPFTITPNTGFHVDSLILDGSTLGQLTAYTLPTVTTNHSLRVVFAIDTFAIISSAGANGTISPLGTTIVDYGSNQLYTITPNTGYHVDSLLVDGANQGQLTSYTFTNVTAPHTIRAAFAVSQYAIFSTAGANGTITPLGTTPISFGSDQAFTITPNTGYHVDSLIVDGANQGPLTSYTFFNVTTPHSIRAAFAINQYVISSTTGANGTISPLGSTIVNHGSTQSYIITPNTGYHVDSLFVDGIYQGPLTAYSFTNVTAAHSIRVVFAINSYIITSTAGPNGTISPLGSTNLNYGTNQSYTITPNTGYHIDSVLVDGVNQGPVPSYTFTNVTSAHTIRAVFAINQFTITSSAGANGSISPSGSISASYGSSPNFLIAANTGYHIDSVFVDGVDQGPVTSFTFTNVTANHTIRAAFAINQYTITSSSGPNGTISPLGSTNTIFGANVTYTVTPNTGYHIDSLIVDGANQGPLSGYTFTAINANRTIRSVFAANSISVTIRTVPPGLTITVDNVPYSSPHTFPWTADQPHTLSVADTVHVSQVRQFVWSSWSDSGARIHTITPLAGGTITANYTTQFWLGMTANAGGTVTPSSGWRDSASVVAIEAIPTFSTPPRYEFTVWSGTGNGSNSSNVRSTTVTMLAPITETANFQRVPVQLSVNTYPPGRRYVLDGVPQTTPVTFTVQPGSTHNLNIDQDPQSDGTPGKQFVWNAWSDGGAKAHQIIPDSDTLIMAVFTTQYFLTTIAHSGGTVAPPSSWQDSGFVVPIAATPAPGYTFAGWRGSGNGSYTGPLNPSSVTMNGAIRDTANFTQFPINVTVQTNPPGMSLIVDGAPLTTPQALVWQSLSNHTITAVDTQAFGGTRYLFTNWNDGGAKSHTVAPSGDTVFTASYSTQFLLTMSTDSGGTFTPGSVWRDTGKVVSILATPNPGFVFSGWTGTGPGSFTGLANPANVTMNGPVSENARFSRYNASVTIQTIPAGLTIFVDSVTYTSPQTFSWRTGDQHVISTAATQSASVGTRYVWSSWSDTGAITHALSVSGNTTFTANFTTQYFLTMIANPGGTVSPISNWYNSGSIVPIQATADQTHSFLLWTGNGSGSYSGNANPTNVTLFGPVTETASFIRLPVTIVIQSIPAGRPFIYDGNIYTDPQTRNVTPGEQHYLNVASPQPGPTGVQYLFKNWSDGGAQTHSIFPDSNATYTVYLSTQYYLTTAAGTGGSVSPPSGFRDSGEVVSILGTPNVTYEFAGWRGKGNGSYTGLNNPALITMNGPINDTATFTQYPVHVTIQTNPPGRAFRVDATYDTSANTYTFISGSSHVISVPDTQMVGTGTRYLWVSWSDGGAKTHNISPTRDTTIIVNFKREYLLTMNASPGGTVTPLTGWRNDSSVVTITASPNPSYELGGWNGTGSGAFTGNLNPASVTMLGPITETASFVQIPVYVTVKTHPDGLSYSVDGVKYSKSEVFTWNQGSQHTLTTLSPQSGGPGVQYAWKTWSDGGSITHIVQPTTDSIFTANYVTQFMLTNSADSNGTVTPPSDWQDSGKSVVLNAIANPGYKFTDWNGTGPGEYTGNNNPVTITMGGPITQVASFARFNASVTFRASPAVKKVLVDSVQYFTPVTFQWITGSTHSIAVADTPQYADSVTRFIWKSWSDSGARSHLITVMKDSITTANFTMQYYLTMVANTGGSVNPPAPGNWYNSGQSVTITGIPADASYRFDHWAGSGSGNYHDANNPATIVIGAPITEIANFTKLAVKISVRTNPPGRGFYFDSHYYSNRQDFNVDPGTPHTLDVISPQPVGAGVRYAWKSWSDGGAQNHTINPTTDSVFVANFGIQYALTMSVNPVDAGSTVPTGVTWSDSAAVAPISATASPGYGFSNWSGDLSSTSPNDSIRMNSPKSVAANFASASRITITSAPSGRSVIVDSISYTTPKTLQWIKGTSHTISTTGLQTGATGVRYLWTSWSDGDSITHNVSTTRDTTFTANFATEYYLTMSSTAGGAVTPASTWMRAGADTLIRATANAGKHLVEWIGTGTGSYSGQNDSAVIVMNGPISESASFATILTPPLLSGVPDNSTGVPTSPTLSWFAYPGAVSYRVQIAKDSSFAGMVYDSAGITDTSYRVASLANLSLYHWRINARVAGNISPYSAKWKFTTITATIVVSSPLLNWGTGYSYKISWSSINLNGPVNIRLFQNNGTTVRKLRDSVAGVGTIVWTVPDSASYVSPVCRIRVESAFNPALYTESSQFAIVNGTLAATITLSDPAIPFSDEPYSSTDYRLFSAPGIADTLTVGMLITGTQVKDWRMFEDNGDTANYLHELSATSRLKTGTGYWLVHKGYLHIPGYVMTVPHLSPDATFAIPLHAGWNIIANPFNRAVPWQSVIDANGLSGSQEISDYYGGAYHIASVLEPFRGYYYFNSGNLTGLKFQYPFGSTPITPGTAPAAVSGENWKVRMTYATDINRDAENYFGVNGESEYGFDASDSRKPPLFLDQGFAYFSRPEWDAKYPRFSSDLRPSIGDGQEWNFELTNPRNSGSTIDFSGLEGIPAGYRVVLLSERNTVPVDLRAHPKVNVAEAGKNIKMRVLVGTDEFVKSETAKLVPAEFELAQNFPNPFNPVTSIGVMIPRDANVKLEIYSILGQRVKTLVDGSMGAGRYTFVWNGSDELGRVMASGVYLYRLTADGAVLQSKKMLFAK